jgi:phospho-N-acetylmuramoyl-pentapeptide-transferase
MLYWLSYALENYFGPFRLFRSHALLLTFGTFLSAFLTWYMLPKLWHLMPHDHGKAILGKDGMKSAGKPTGAGVIVTLVMLPAIILCAPLSVCDMGVVLCLYAAMAFGFLDDASSVPWGQLKKGLLDMVVSLGAAMFLYASQGGELWLPLVKTVWVLPWWVYIPGAGFLLWFTMNATNCSDGVDALAGSLTLISLVCLASLLYVVIGYAPIAKYLLLPFNPNAARWAILLMTAVGALCGYLWWNAEPSKVLMGDAGSRFLGMLVGVGVLVTGNPLLVFAVAPIVLVNGGGGLGKLVLLRTLKRFNIDVRHPSTITELEQAAQSPIVRMIHSVRFPLHDHCKRVFKWSNAQVLMRFMILQAFLTPILFILLVKVR